MSRPLTKLPAACHEHIPYPPSQSLAPSPPPAHLPSPPCRCGAHSDASVEAEAPSSDGTCHTLMKKDSDKTPFGHITQWPKSALQKLCRGQPESCSQVYDNDKACPLQPQTSPVSTAIVECPTQPPAQCRTARGWITAVLMVVVGSLIALTFIMIGLGKALTANSAQQKQALAHSAAGSSLSADHSINAFAPTPLSSASLP